MAKKGLRPMCSLKQLDATSKVVYRHEIICTGNTAEFNQQLFVCRQCCGCLALDNLLIRRMDASDNAIPESGLSYLSVFEIYTITSKT